MDEVDHGIGATNRVGDRFGIEEITAAPLDAVIIKFAVRGVRWPSGECDQIESSGQLLEKSAANESAGTSDRDAEPWFLGIWPGRGPAGAEGGREEGKPSPSNRF